MALNNSKQTNLEKKGFERREYLQTRSDFNKNDEYSASHEMARSNPERDYKPEQGKGTGHPGHGHSVPDASRSGYDLSNFDTSNGGGKYDIYGRNEIGGRLRSVAINIYNENESYGPDSIDTSLNVAEGQYVFKD